MPNWNICEDPYPGPTKEEEPAWSVVKPGKFRTRISSHGPGSFPEVGQPFFTNEGNLLGYVVDINYSDYTVTLTTQGQF
jgi:hypothetical protein